jgi:DNA primase
LSSARSSRAEGARCRGYLAERAISAESIERYGLGFAPGGFDNSCATSGAKAIRRRRVAAGLLVARTTPALRPVRERLMFPIQDLAGRVVAFGGRVLPGTQVSATIRRRST